MNNLIVEAKCVQGQAKIISLTISLTLTIMTALAPAWSRHANTHSSYPVSSRNQTHSKQLIALKTEPASQPTGPNKTVSSKPAPAHPSANSAQNKIDLALLAVLRDISKSLKESSLPTVEDAGQKLALTTALAALNKAFGDEQVHVNRIILSENKAKLEKDLHAQTWHSPSLNLDNGASATLAVLWARKINGLINITITGNGGENRTANGDRIGEFVIVINGRSTLDNGFDIQSQNNVNFWLGKLTNLSIETGETKLENQTATAPASQPTPIANNQSDTSANAPEPATIASAINPAITINTDINNAEKPAEPAIAASETATETDSKPASQNAHAISPERAIAGEFITIVVLDAEQKPESSVAVDFNGKTITTSEQGKALFQIPEETPPGPTLQIKLPGRANATPLAVDIFQPLTKRQQNQQPSIDHIVNTTTGSTRLITIDGHNFDGIAEHNKVLIDGSLEATVLVASPIQIKALVPSKVAAGQHNVSVTSNGLRSNLTQCELSSPRAEVAALKRKLANRPSRARNK